ncbi:hypothetical protein GCM10029976_008910 [Kribbella albertanoniae]|uniref:Secreted protein n=1 Tax=Kribbella albertanoniae TaxID=1266829 RepID=A0A4R4Q517_9ACTN|nr:hypothetical protein [Kribbella albertanoniae]TDC30197.1 hypothetical protein E1261_13985 [Kribbella albertanoniae]
MRARLTLAAAATAAAVLVTGGASSTAAEEPDTKAGKDCRETSESLPIENDYVYLYSESKCAGAHDAKDDSSRDSDYGDGKGQIKDFDNQAGSLINHSDSTVEFYTRTGYSHAGDRFCVRPRHYVTKLYMYGDGKQEAGSWSNSISSHRQVSPADCKRFFGWRILLRK